MTWYGLSVFSLAYVLAVASPGPGVAAIIARSLGHGLRGAPAFIGGFMVGDLIWFTCAATGLAMLAQGAYTVFLVVKYAGVAYLLYLAYRLWTAPAKPIDASRDVSRERPLQLFLGSLALTLGNPKTMIFFLAVLPTVVELKSLSVTGFFEIVLVILVILPTVLGGYAFGASRARRLFSRPQTVRWVQRGTGVAMASAAVAVVTR
ncbi:MAG: lysine transporter LysE [Gammaproteobacteria bacterium]|nr:lysine transporter LysE [Gammaproteobacteria bacterium]